MAVLSIQKASINGIEPNFNDADEGGDKFLKTGPVIIYLRNVSVEDITVTIASQVQNVPPGTARQDKNIIIRSDREIIIGQIDDAYADMNGYVHLSYSEAIGLSLAIIGF